MTSPVGINPRPPIPSSFDDGEIVTTSLKDHLPRTVVHVHSAAIQEVTLWAVGTSGLKEKRWTLASKSWNNGFIKRGNDTARARVAPLEPFNARDQVAASAWGPRLAMVSSFDGTARAHVRGAFAFNGPSGSGKIGCPSLLGNPRLGSTAVYDWRRHDAQAGGLVPRTAFSWREGTAARVNCFGNDATKQNLTELNFDGSNWNQSVHPKPEIFDGRMLLGSHSSVWDSVSGQGYVFVEMNSNNKFGDADRFWCRHWNGSNWSWINLHSPFHYRHTSGYSDEGLVAVGYREGSNFVIKLVMNGATVDQGGGDAVFVLTMTNSRPSEWQQWKVPSGHRYTSGLAWDLSGTRRINVFGHSADGKLLHFYMSGSTWAFGDPSPAPGGQAFRTDASYVVEGTTYKRIAAVGRSSTGRIHECVYTIDNGSQVGWNWFDLSTHGIQSRL